MPIYVCSESALQHYRRAPFPAKEHDAISRASNLKDAVSTLGDVNLLDLAGLCVEPPSIEAPLHVLVSSPADRGRSTRVIPSVWGASLPKGAFRRVQADVYVSSPEFLFLQMARELELIPLIALGMELCGTYRREALGKETLYDRTILTTPDKIAKFLAQAGPVHGAKRARAALKHVAPNSASPFETIVYLLLCLPRRLGGYGFPQPELNAAIRLSKRGRQHTLRKSSIPDLYWRDAKLDLECHGKVHEETETRTEDSMRRKALERMHVEVFELVYEEVENPRLFHATVRLLSKKLGKRLRSSGERHFSERELKLRRELLPANVQQNMLWSDALVELDTTDDYGDWTGEELPSEFDSWEVYMGDGDVPEL